jgi:hypothetical protein
MKYVYALSEAVPSTGREIILGVYDDKRTADKVVRSFVNRPQAGHITQPTPRKFTVQKTEYHPRSEVTK